MTYADTDFFLALIKESDWLQSRARKLLAQHQGKLWTSGTTVIELLLLASRYKLDAERIIQNLLQIAELRFMESAIALLAAHFVKRYGLGVFDAMHAAYCSSVKDWILSSDVVFEKVGLQRIALERE